MARESAARNQQAAPRPPQARPFLKWAGGKGQLLAQLRPLLPAAYRRYFEPFAGGAALFFALAPKRAVLADVNAELVDCYKAARDDVDGVIAALGEHRYEAEHYYRVRAVDPASLAPADRAARTIYLNRTGYNGLYRVNRAGKFNVPMGRYTNPLLCDADNLRACSKALAGVVVRRADFEQAVEGARAGDFVYFDPPYVPVSDTADFTSYVPGGFGADQQRRLADLFAALARRGVHAVLSNSDTPSVRDLYRGFRIHRVLASRHINSRGTRRGKVGEVVVTTF
ncbi:MAG TPA: DNA adenine methylase [Polyangiaceae bacterium]|jgi:DNA adenine methylase|nr:DNA adenine methylase [Polyangiaceae bacterium]